MSDNHGRSLELEAFANARSRALEALRAGGEMVRADEAVGAWRSSLLERSREAIRRYNEAVAADSSYLSQELAEHAFHSGYIGGPTESGAGDE